MIKMAVVYFLRCSF